MRTKNPYRFLNRLHREWNRVAKNTPMLAIKAIRAKERVDDALWCLSNAAAGMGDAATHLRRAVLCVRGAGRIHSAFKPLVEVCLDAKRAFDEVEDGRQ